jgi:uncharacterized protein (DUF4415 family)
MPKRINKKPSLGRTNFRLFRKMTDAEIERTSPPELANLPYDFWKSAVMVFPSPKRAISLRVDEDVLDWFKAGGPRYQSRMNSVLRAYMSAARGAKPHVRKVSEPARNTRRKKV